MRQREPLSGNLPAMRWLDDPPALSMNVVKETATGLELAGPTAGERAMSGVTAGMGGVFTAMGLRFLRAPLPPPFKVIPAVFTLVGAGVTALGAGAAFAKCRVRVSREGITWRWRFGPLRERTATVVAKDVKVVELKKVTHHSSDSDGWSTTWTSWVVQAVAVDGKTRAIDDLGSEESALRRRASVEALLRKRSRPSRARPARRRGPARRS